MKPILIDDLIENSTSITNQVTVVVDGNTLKGYQIAKPLNYNPEYLSIKDRQEMADAVLEGKAIAVRFFVDLTDEEQVKYVKSKLINLKTI